MTSDAPRRSGRASRAVAIASAALVLLGVGLVVAVGLAFPRTSACPEVVGYRVGDLDPSNTQVLGVLLAAVGLVALLIALAVAVGAERPGLQVVLAFFALAGVLGLLPLMVIGATFARTYVYTEIDSGTTGRDLLVREWSFLLGGGGEVVERDGIWLTRIARTGADDGYTPFADGAYSVTDVGGELTLRWRTHSEDSGLDTGLVLPPPGEPAPDVLGGCALPRHDEQPAG